MLVVYLVLLCLYILVVCDIWFYGFVLIVWLVYCL